jgi:hypothetical protein
MKFCILSFFVIVISICSCKKLNTRNEQEKNIFSPALKTEILRMIEVKNKKVHNRNTQLKVCNVVIAQNINRDETCTVIISLSTSILRKTTKFVPPSASLNIQINSNIEMVGYTFIKNELIACYWSSDSCNDNLVNKNELIPYKNSIQDYPDVAKEYSDIICENPIRVYKLVGDSLQLIKSEWIDIF